MNLTQMVSETTPYLNAAGFGALGGGAAHLAVSGLRALGPGSTLAEEFMDTRNLIFGIAAGLACAAAGHEYAQNITGLHPAVLKYVGAATVGGLAGLVINPVVGAVTSKESISDNVSRKISTGFVAGATILPLAYLAADLAAKYM